MKEGHHKGKVVEIWRHPIKSCGREALLDVTLNEGEAMPYDRRWAVVHENSKVSLTDPTWMPCANFSIGTKNPALAAISAKLEPSTDSVTLIHPQNEAISFSPDDEADTERALEWLQSLLTEGQPAVKGIVNLKARGATDTDYPSISLVSASSLATLSEDAGAELDMKRFRGNICFEGFPPFAEFEMIGKQMKLGDAIVEIVEPIERCKLTTTNPETGIRDVDILSRLRNRFQHQNFGVYAKVIKRGNIKIGSEVNILS